MIDFFQEAFENPGFWILAGGAVAMELIGWIISKRMMEHSFPLWQMIIVMAGTVIAAAFFANRG